MMDPDKVNVGDLVEVTEAFKDYAKLGNVYRILADRVPKEPTSALGWLVDFSTGRVDLTQAYKLPHDKVTLVSRKKAAWLFQRLLAEVTSKKKAADREYALVRSRIDGLLYYESKEDEVKSLMSKTFYDC